MDFCCFYFPLFCIHWLMGYYLLPADSAGHADDIRSDTMGVLAVAQVGRCMGEVAYPIPDRAFLRGDALLRRILRVTAVRHRALHTGGEPDGYHGQRADDGCLPAEQLLLGRLPDGGKHRSSEVPEPGAGPGSVDDSGRRHGLLDPKLRRGCGAAGQDDGNGRHRNRDERMTNLIKR